jgi:hypothetical protein
LLRQRLDVPDALDAMQGRVDAARDVVRVGDGRLAYDFEFQQRVQQRRLAEGVEIFSKARAIVRLKRTLTTV